ncbi:alpha/beta hydrolase [Colwellia sp. E2M01]|uniref:alpha/beta hydrolase n=1 Tax=Colwellia sp. E2M01 TaxID=2841561 RepID=UPI001C09E382|nr:alpha/beta hydrolase [Colwellia sp. E2M01]MBU2872211.1 alpha/beta hydrolase [Colwellia sp. E2M01]
MRYLNKYALLLLCLIAALLFFKTVIESSDNQQAEINANLYGKDQDKNQTKDTATCLSINNDYVELIKSGKYRFTTEVKSNKLAVVDFTHLDSYQQYIAQATEVINNKNPRANMPCPIITDTYVQLAQQNNWASTPTVGQLVAPYELTQPVHNKSSKAVLLIHGLTDSPYGFHDISQYFYKKGFTVRTVLLPGHATAPSDLLDVEFIQWQQATKFAIEQTLADFDEVYLGGLSTGQALIFDYVMSQPSIDNKIKGLFMWSPASKAKNDLAWLAQYVDRIPSFDWIDLDADIDFAKYESFTYNAGAQVYDVMNLIVGREALDKKRLQDLPVFVVVSEYDQTIDTMHTLHLIQDWQQVSSQNKMQKSVLIYYGEAENLPKELPKLMTVIVPECSAESLCSDIFGVSHIATTNSPDNPHYGVNGEYRNCGHYLKDAIKYKECKHNEQVIKGEVTELNLLREFPMQRLTYNPYYQEMLESMGAFLKATSLVNTTAEATE